MRLEAAAASRLPRVGKVCGASILRPRLHLLQLQGAFRGQYQAVSSERFFDKVVGAAFYGGDSSLFIAVTGDHYDRQFGMLLFKAIQQLKAI